MTAASRSLATALSGARFASGLLRLSYTTPGDRTRNGSIRPVRPTRKWTALDAKRKFLGVLMVRSPKHQLSRLNIFML